MKKIIKELVYFALFAYLAIWLSYMILIAMNLRSATLNLSDIENVYLVQLSFFVWVISVLMLYILRLIFYFINSKLNPEADKDSP